MRINFQYRIINSLFLVIGDAAVTIFCFWFAYWLRYSSGWIPIINYIPLSEYGKNIPLFCGVVLFAFFMQKNYQKIRLRFSFKEFLEVVQSVTYGSGMMLLALISYHSVQYSRLTTVLIFLFSIIGLSFWRFSFGRISRALLNNQNYTQKIVILGRNPERIKSLVGASEPFSEIIQTIAVQEWDHLLPLIQQQNVDVIIATEPLQEEMAISLLDACRGKNIALKIVPDRLTLMMKNVTIDDYAQLPLIRVHDFELEYVNKFFKRLFDILVASILLCLLMPFLGVVALLVKITSSGGVIFRQKRVGQNGIVFTMLKFRSMVQNAETLKKGLQQNNEKDKVIFKMKKDPRITPLGRFLRRYSIDELPQLWNVLKGDMSLVGPRPALPNEVAAYDAWHRRRLHVLPGITGLWQVSGRSELSFDEMVKLDLFYIENWSLVLDIKILIKTVLVVIKAKGAW